MHPLVILGKKAAVLAVKYGPQAAALAKTYGPSAIDAYRQHGLRKPGAFVSHVRADLDRRAAAPKQGIVDPILPKP